MELSHTRSHTWPVSPPCPETIKTAQPLPAPSGHQKASPWVYHVPDYTPDFSLLLCKISRSLAWSCLGLISLCSPCVPLATGEGPGRLSTWSLCLGNRLRSTPSPVASRALGELWEGGGCAQNGGSSRRILAAIQLPTSCKKL